MTRVVKAESAAGQHAGPRPESARRPTAASRGRLCARGPQRLRRSRLRRSLPVLAERGGDSQCAYIFKKNVIANKQPPIWELTSRRCLAQIVAGRPGPNCALRRRPSVFLSTPRSRGTRASARKPRAFCPQVGSATETAERRALKYTRDASTGT